MQPPTIPYEAITMETITTVKIKTNGAGRVESESTNELQSLVNETDGDLLPDITIQKTSSSRLNTIDWDNLGFGVYFSDHMFTVDYIDQAWKSPCIVPYGKIEIEPALCTLHYGQAVFEGLKAFAAVDDTINIFRPQLHSLRLNGSCEKLCIPKVDERLFLEALVRLVTIDRNWIPKKRGSSLYIRPLIYGSDNFLGVHPSANYNFTIMTSPVSSYYKEGMNPVKILVSSEYVRAVKGGLGSAKTPANYAASLLAATKAKQQGYTQVLWLDGITREFVDEVGTMNIFFYINDELITPPLEGTILAGVTRDSVLTIARSWGMKVSERRISMDEVVSAHASGELKEIFGTGTAAVISPVGELTYREKKMAINESKIGELALQLCNEISDIQYGVKPDRFGWILKVQ